MQKLDSMACSDIWGSSFSNPLIQELDHLVCDVLETVNTNLSILTQTRKCAEYIVNDNSRYDTQSIIEGCVKELKELENNYINDLKGVMKSKHYTSEANLDIATDEEIKTYINDIKDDFERLNNKFIDPRDKYYYTNINRIVCLSRLGVLSKKYQNDINLIITTSNYPRQHVFAVNMSGYKITFCD